MIFFETAFCCIRVVQLGVGNLEGRDQRLISISILEGKK